MKLNNVIILNRRHMKEFFSFSDFWSQRNEFKDVVNNDMFFKHKDKINNKNQLKAQILNWIANRSSTTLKLNQRYITLPSGDNISRFYTNECESELELLKPEEAYGIVCLYEMMERKLKQDIYEILGCLGYEKLNPESGVILVTEKSVEFESYVNDGKNNELELNNVLIINQSANDDAIIRFNNKEYPISPSGCVRSIFIGNKCLKILQNTNSMKFSLNIEQHTTWLSIDGTVIKTEDNVLAFAIGSKGYIYVVDSVVQKLIARHSNINDNYFINPIEENDEKIVYVELNGKETECLLLTNKKNLYLCKSNNDNEILHQDSDVVMATYQNNNLQITKY